MRMIQNLNQSFGSPVNRINLLTKELINALLQEKDLKFRNYWDLVRIKSHYCCQDSCFILLD